MEYVDVTLQDFYSLLETRGVNKTVIQSNIMRQVLEIAPLLEKAYNKLHPLSPPSMQSDYMKWQQEELDKRYLHVKE